MRLLPTLAGLFSAGISASMALMPLPPPEPPTRPLPSTSPLPAKTLLSIGDSLTDGVSYREHLSRLLNRTGQPHTWVVYAAPGSKCSRLAAELGAIIAAHDPDIIFLNCGTNDTPDDDTEADYRTILAIAAAHEVPVVASLIGQPDMRSDINRSRPWIDDWMRATNEAIKRALAGYPSVPFANFERIPANPEFLTSDGIHWQARARDAAAQLLYEAAQPRYPGWKTLAQMRVAPMCGLNGSRDTDPWPIPGIDYQPCLS